MEDKVGYTQEEKNQYSMMRLMNITSLWVSIVFAAVCVVLACYNLVTGAQYALGISVLHLSAAYGGKLVQKLMENDNFFLFKK